MFFPLQPKEPWMYSSHYVYFLKCSTLICPSRAHLFDTILAEMSSRFYPRFVKGNPQLRIFLPDWKMVMIKLKEKAPQNIVTFKIDPRMTNWDIKNYLEKIYKVQVGHVQSFIVPGEIKRTREGLKKDEDYRIANVTLAIGQKFVWPDLYPEEKINEELAEQRKLVKELNKKREAPPQSKDIPNWFL